MAAIPEYDAVLIGAGFGSITTLHRLRKLGFNCRVYEKGARSGGIWYWNCYPGARVDSDAPIYQLFDKDIYNDFEFTERYPGWQELRRYFDYLDKKLDLSKDIQYNAELEGARFDEERRQWLLHFKDGSQVYCRWFIPCIGFAAKSYTPPYPGIEKFKGEIYHTAQWPQQGVDLKGKRIAVIGTGASGVQTIQESGRDSKQLTVYQRTPNYCLPMNQRTFKPGEMNEWKNSGRFDTDFESLKKTFAGFTYTFNPKNTFDDSEEERRKHYHHLMVEEGGFKFWLNNYDDLFSDLKANREAYNFWRDTVRERIKDPRKQEILAPTEPPHPWGTKRPSLEQFYYEIYNLPQVDLEDISANPIEEFTETGIRNKDGTHRDFDVVALATGFDAVTGSLAQLDVRGTHGMSIKEHWQNGLKTAIGIALNGFPNMFFLYGPQAPTAFSNGPSCVQFQAEWLSDTLDKLKREGITRFEATSDLEQQWTKRTTDTWEDSLFPMAKSWYQGANIPGRKVEPLNWAGGMPQYIEALNESNANNYQGWVTATA